MWQRQLRKIVIGALDQATLRIAESEELAEAKVAKLARRWNKLDREEKQQIAEVMVSIASAIAMAVAAIARAESKKKRRRVVKKLGRKAVKELAVVAGTSLRTAKKSKKK